MRAPKLVLPAPGRFEGRYDLVKHAKLTLLTPEQEFSGRHHVWNAHFIANMQWKNRKLCATSANQQAPRERFACLRPWMEESEEIKCSPSSLHLLQ